MSDSTAARTGPPSAAQPLFILAVDHRDSFGRVLFGVRLTPDREALIRKAAAGAEPHGSLLAAWMTQSLLAEVDALRTGQ
jgi:hypothetical protein